MKIDLGVHPIRGALAIGVVGSIMAAFLLGNTIPEGVLVLGTAIVTFYFVDKG